MKKNLLVWPYKLLRRYGRDRVSSYSIIFNSSLMQYEGKLNCSTTIWANPLIKFWIIFHQILLMTVLINVCAHKWRVPEIVLWLLSACIFTLPCY